MWVCMFRGEVFSLPSLGSQSLVSLVSPWLSIICLLSLCPRTKPSASLRRSGEVSFKNEGAGEPQVTLSYL